MKEKVSWIMTNLLFKQQFVTQFLFASDVNHWNGSGIDVEWFGSKMSHY